MTDAQPTDTLSRELEGLEGLMFRIAQTQGEGSLREAALKLVCEAIYLARQVAATHTVERRDVANLTAAVDKLVGMDRTARINAIKAQVWPLLSADLQNLEGASRKGVDYALHIWLDAQADFESQDAATLASRFTQSLAG